MTLTDARRRTAAGEGRVCGKAAAHGGVVPMCVMAGGGRSITMHAWITTYRRDDLLIEVLAGESHSAAWAAVMDPDGASPGAGSRPVRSKRRVRMAARAQRDHTSHHHATKASRRSHRARVAVL